MEDEWYMKKSIFVFLLALLFLSPALSIAAGADKWTETEKLSYILGVQMGQFSEKAELTLDTELVIRGIEDLRRGRKIALSPEEIKDVMTATQMKLQQKQRGAVSKAGKANIKKGRAYLEKNKKKKGVRVTGSGLQYKVIKKGRGRRPGARDRVKVHYRGTLIDGTEFDSSYKRNKPSVFGVSQVIAGWIEGLQLMKPGAKYEFYIPENLAYGPNGPPSIGPNQALIFEVELIEVVK